MFRHDKPLRESPNLRGQAAQESEQLREPDKTKTLTGGHVVICKWGNVCYIFIHKGWFTYIYIYIFVYLFYIFWLYIYIFIYVFLYVVVFYLSFNIYIYYVLFSLYIYIPYIFVIILIYRYIMYIICLFCFHRHQWIVELQQFLISWTYSDMRHLGSSDFPSVGRFGLHVVVAGESTCNTYIHIYLYTCVYLWTSKSWQMKVLGLKP